MPYNGELVNGTRYALGVSLRSGRRLTFGADYTERVTGTAADGSRNVSIVVRTPVATTDQIRVVYQSPTVA